MFRLPPNPPSFLEIASLLYLGIRAHQWLRKSKFLTLTYRKEDFATPRRRRLRRGIPKTSRIRQTGSLQLGPPRCCEALRRSVECLTAACPNLHCTSHYFLYFGSFFYYLASFFIPISTCPKKHYSMGD